MSEELNSGLLIIGVTSTVLFSGGTPTTELILLNLSDGADLTLPVSDEQAEAVVTFMNSVGEEGLGHGGNGVAHVSEVHDFAQNIGLGEVGVVEVGPPGESDITPQF